MLISKTIFQDFIYCPRNVWLKFHKPELLSHYTLSDFEKHLMEQGNNVETYARNLFPNGVEIKTTGERASKDTLNLIASKATTIFQATFIVDGFIVRNDALSYDPKNDCWDLYEVKGTNSLKENTEERDHIIDVTFQASVLKRAGVKIGHYHVIHLNKEYIRVGELNCKSLFIIEDVTEKVLDSISDVESKMAIAKSYLNDDNESIANCDCIYRGRSKHCTTFNYSHPRVPEYSVHDISRIHKKKLEKLVDVGTFDLNDVPEDFELSDKQKNQVLAHQTQRPIIDTHGISKELDALKFPLYFFDYEALGPAIPVFDGYGPYKRIPFQFSIHILKTPTSELEHIEYLHPDLTDPSKEVAKLLKQYILPGGTVIAWHKSYEAGVNREIGLRLPEYAEFFEQVNNSLYDLKDIFHDQLYIHHGFHGSASLKKVLPTLAPELQYSVLEVQDGGQAMDAWWKMVSPQISKEEAAKISVDLKKYCGLDTYAMYAIWKHLYDLVKTGIAA